MTRLEQLLDSLKEVLENDAQEFEVAGNQLMTDYLRERDDFVLQRMSGEWLGYTIGRFDNGEAEEPEQDEYAEVFERMAPAD